MKKIFAILILSIILCTSLFTAGVLAYADTVGMDDTPVLEDLKGSYIGGEWFNPDNYTYSQEKAPTVLSFAEFGFAADTSDIGDYALYVYVYNPSGKAILNTLLNKISIATVYENGQAVDYEKFSIEVLSASTDKYANLFWKFKVLNADRIFARVSQNTSLRRYDIAELELNFGSATSEPYLVGNSYEYSGFAQGYGADPEADSTLSCRCNSIETLQLKVSSTYYRRQNGVNTQSNMNSVYFGVPSETLEKYGKLSQIKANWFETKTDIMCVFGNAEMYNALLPLANSSSHTTAPTFPDDYVGLYGDPSSYLSSGDFTTSKHNWIYPHDAHFDATTERDILPWIFYTAETDGRISADEVLSYAQTYTQRYGGEKLIDKYSKLLFVEEVDEGRQYGWQGVDGNGMVIDADSTFDINGFTTGSKFGDWWSSLFYKDLEFDDLKNISPIYLVKDADVLGSDETVANRLLIDQNDVGNFKKFFNQNKIEGKKTVLFRFAITDYVTDGLYADRPHYNLGGFGMMDGYTSDKMGYWCQQTAFLDFDIIWLKFAKEGQETVIPVVSNPIDVFSGLTPPLSNDGLNVLAIIIAALVVVLIAVCVYKLFTVKRKKK